MSRSRKIWAGILLITAIFAVVVLASGISNTSYVLGPSLGTDAGVTTPFQEEIIEYSGSQIAEWKIYLIVAILVVMTIAGIILDHKRFIAIAVAAAIIITIIVLMGRTTETAEMPTIGFNTTAAGNTFETTDGPRLESPITEQTAAPETGVAIISYLIIAAIVAVVGGVTAFLLYRYQNRPKQPPLREIATQAEATIATIEAGGDLRDAILRCYVEMNQLVGSRHGMRRAEAMTPREFEESLIAGGLPSSSVKRLTRLFEGVRYGGEMPGKRQELEALSALREIVDAVNADLAKRSNSAEKQAPELVLD